MKRKEKMIDDYFRGKLSEEDNITFLRLFAEDNNFKNTVVLYALIIRGIKNMNQNNRY